MGIISNNEYDEAWLDESFATYSAAPYDKELDQLTAEPISGYHLSSPVSDFTTHGEEDIAAYYNMIYDYGSRTLNNLRKLLGDEQYASIQAYFKEKKFGITTTKDFIRIMKKPAAGIWMLFSKSISFWIGSRIRA